MDCVSKEEEKKNACTTLPCTHSTAQHREEGRNREGEGGGARGREEVEGSGEERE